MGVWNIGSGRSLKAKYFELLNDVRIVDGNGFPKSGTYASGASAFQGVAGSGPPKGSLYVDSDSGVVFQNEGTAVTTYWTPIHAKQRGLMGIMTDFSDGFGPEQTNVPTLGKAVADTAMSGLLTNGMRVFGQGMADTDSGLTVAFTATDGKGPVASLVTTNEDAHLAALSHGPGTTATWQPDQHGTMVIDVLMTNSSAITVRNNFVGFIGGAADALDPIMTYATTVITNVDADIVGLVRSSELTDSAGIFNIFFNEAASGTVDVSESGVDAGVDMAAAGTYQRFRVEVHTDGSANMFIDKALVGSLAAGSVDADEEFIPVVIIESTDANTKTILLRHYHAWGARELE